MTSPSVRERAVPPFAQDDAPQTLREPMVRLMAGRQSVPPRQLLAPGPTPAASALILRAALATPSHGGLRTFRFIDIAPDQRDALAEVFVAAKREEDPDADTEDMRRARDKAYHAPCLWLLVARIYADHPDIPAIEQIASAGAALGAVLNAAHVLGYGAMAVSGDKLATGTLRTAFALAIYEQPLAFIAIGTPSKPPRDKVRLQPADVMSAWRGIGAGATG